MSRSRRPVWRLRLERCDHGFVIQNVDLAIQRRESGLMRKQLRERYVLFSSLGEFRPELRDTMADVDLVFLQNVKKGGASESFRCGPNQNDCVVAPRLFAPRIAKAAMKVEEWSAALPNRDCCTELAELLEVFLKQRLETRAEFVGVKLHPKML